MGAEEGAAITVLSKGVRFADVSANPTALLDAFGRPTGPVPEQHGLADGGGLPGEHDAAGTAVSATNPTTPSAVLSAVPT